MYTWVEARKRTIHPISAYEVRLTLKRRKEGEVGHRAPQSASQMLGVSEDMNNYTDGGMGNTRPEATPGQKVQAVMAAKGGSLKKGK